MLSSRDRIRLRLSSKDMIMLVLNCFVLNWLVLNVVLVRQFALVRMVVLILKIHWEDGELTPRRHHTVKGNRKCDAHEAGQDKIIVEMFLKFPLKVRNKKDLRNVETCFEHETLPSEEVSDVFRAVVP
ncbi:hypothetical protein V6N13_037858 [Hibiscus sabdariffa]